jgi:hypothetical protein
VLGADPPWVFKRWMNVVLVKKLPPVGPASVPIACNKRQGMAPLFGQLWSEPAGIDCSVFPHTLLLSKELCQLALPNGSGVWGELVGVGIGAKEMCHYLHVPVKDINKKGRFGASGGDSPGSSESACARGQANIALSPHRLTQQNAEFPAGGVSALGVVGGVIFCAPAWVTPPNIHPSARMATNRLRTRVVFFVRRLRLTLICSPVSGYFPVEVVETHRLPER